ncbi:MAG TPA: HemK2/MTQ2 family protein methyltransferase [Capillimicrobium sp.]|nr:HemK2/MTQ2 family protein methyltransferase [Capillimicrobium sp.]
MRIFTLPGVFKPRSDSWLLAEQLRQQTLPPRASVLDLCTGSGLLAVCAAQRGARDVTAVDVSRRAVWTVRINARLNGVRVRALRGSLFEPLGDRRFDAIVSNPPYVPAETDALPTSGPQRAWDAGLDGRALLDVVCREAPAHLKPGGFVLITHSSICGTDRTLELLRAGGLEAEVVARRRGPLGPLLRARVATLERRGLLEPGRREEEVLVIRGRRPHGRAAADPVAAPAAVPASA